MVQGWRGLVSLIRPWDHDEYPYFVEIYYAEDHPNPKKRGMLNIKTKHKSEASRDMEIDAANSREDIGKVIWGYR